MSSVAGFLCLAGTELVNEERTRAYLRNCLGDSSWQFFDCDCPPLAASIVEGGCFLVLDGTAGTNATTPAIPAVGGAEELELEWFGTLESYASGAQQALVTQYVTAGDNRAFSLHLHAGGTLRAFVSPDGTFGAGTEMSRSQTATNGDEAGFRFTWRASDGRMQLFEADDPTNPATTWTQLGGDATGPTAPLLNSSVPVEIGTRFNGGDPAEGKFTRVVIRVAATVASPDFSAQAPGTTSFTDAEGNVWTLNGNAEIACTLDAYGSPATDPAPWYSSAHPASEKFFGFLPERSELSVPTSRAVTQRIDGGGVLGPELLLPRNVEFRGWLVAADEEGMRWGIRWMQEVLRGRICAPGCSPGDLSLLTSCADESYYREMVGAGLVDGPRFDVAVPDGRSSVAVPTQFQLAVERPFLYHDPSEVVSGEVAAGTSECAFFTTEEWFDGADLQIEISSEANASDLTLTMAVSLDGTCDEQAQPCAKLQIPLLPAEGKLTIDGRRRQVRFFNPTRRTEEAGYRVVDWIGAFPYFDVSSCAQMCICLDNAGGQPVSWTVTKWEREL